MKLGLGTLLLAALLAVSAPPARAGLRDADCGDLDIRLTGAAAEGDMECRRGETGGGDNGKSTDELLQVRGPLSLLVILYARAGVRTYINSIGAKEMIESFAVFDSTADWGTPMQIHDFTARPFKGVFSGSSTTMPCVGFTRHASRVAGSTGYRHGLWGFYCEFIGEAVGDDKIGDILGGVQMEF
jgi:hypothetical protein